MIDLGELAVKKAIELGATEAEAYLVKGKQFYVALENNDIKLAKSQIMDGIGIRVFKNKSLGFASVNTFSQDKVISAVSNAVRLANLTPKDDANSMPSISNNYKQVQGIFDSNAEKIGMDEVLKFAQRMLATALKFDSRITVDSGIFAGGFGENAVVNSNGIKLAEKASSFDFGIMGMARDKDEVSCFQYEFDTTHNIADINVENVAMIFAKKAISSLGAKKGESFTGPIILEPDVFADMLGVIIAAVSANNIQKKMSRLVGQLNKQIAVSELTIEDNGLLAGGAATSAFDREGVARQPLKIIDNGVLTSYLYNTYCANKDKSQSTGHAVGGTRVLPSIGASNIIVNAGNKSQADLIKEIKRGLYVTRLSAQPNPVSGDFSGVVKGGFLIENGEFKMPVIETMISGNIFDLLNRISGLSSERKKVMSFLVPYCRIEDVSITSG
jgi:PmbA protein